MQETTNDLFLNIFKDNARIYEEKSNYSIMQKQHSLVNKVDLTYMKNNAKKYLQSDLLKNSRILQSSSESHHQTKISTAINEMPDNAYLSHVILSLLNKSVFLQIVYYGKWLES